MFFHPELTQARIVSQLSGVYSQQEAPCRCSLCGIGCRRQRLPPAGVFQADGMVAAVSRIKIRILLPLSFGRMLHEATVSGPHCRWRRGTQDHGTFKGCTCCGLQKATGTIVCPCQTSDASSRSSDRSCRICAPLADHGTIGSRQATSRTASAAIRRAAASAEEPGFWPVINWPSCTVNEPQSGPAVKLPPLAFSTSSTR
jgi:hypothetical protein